MRQSDFLVILVLLGGGLLRAAEPNAPPIRFAREVRPILAEHCFHCHGPDAKQRQGELRLDTEADAKHLRDGHAAVVPHQLERSQLWQRITSANPDERMPPPDAPTKLSAAQIETLRRWIEQGATWEQHWSFVAPTRPSLPTVREASRLANPIDAFVAAKVEAVGLRPSPPADKETLIRRVTLDLTGLPPTLEEIDAFLSDNSPNAYFKLVERLLASPRYGERMAWNWLEAARYADTSGYQNDGPRSMWRWRDWVIGAFNAGLSFDQFTIEQLAGDLLPGARLDQRIATGFNRNHRGNSEGGIIPEEYQVEYVVDRVDTTCTVWLGLTMGCARCHDHKYDPISQREFYQVFAYFNRIPEYGRAIKEGNSPPSIPAPTSEQQQQLAELETRLSNAQQQWESLAASLEPQQVRWESTLNAQSPLVTTTPHGLVAAFALEPTASDRPFPWKVVAGKTKTESGRVGQAVRLDGQQFVDAGDVGNFGYLDDFSVAVWVKPSEIASGTLLSRMTDEEQADGWYVQLRDGHVQVNLVKRWLDDALRVETEATIPADQWTHITVTYDGSRQASGVSVYLGGGSVRLETQLDLLNQTFATKEPLRLGGGNGSSGRFAGLLDEVTVFDRRLTSEEALRLATAESILEIVSIPPENRTPGQRSKLRDYFVRQAAPDEWRSAYAQREKLQADRQALVASFPTVMVMEEMPQPRETRVLIRGEYNRPGEPVNPGVPVALPLLPTEARPDRLALARWLVAPDNPLTARVAANRLWQMHFGAGLVRTTEDFGAQGEPPSHPELLDWLASEFASGLNGAAWDTKRLQRTIVTSATYQQVSGHVSAAPSPSGNVADLDNRLLARFPRVRLSAEMLRDQALAASGLLVEQIGGPSVKIYQPSDLWKDLATDSVYEQDHGAKLYRRSLYTYWKRTVAPPSLTTFDAAGREACQVRSPRTNTPLQALTLLNEVTFVEAARVLAERVLNAENSDEERLILAFRLATSRRPTRQELRLLIRALQRNISHFQQQPDAAKQFVAQGESPRSDRLDRSQLAAYATVCSLLLNLDETVTRQ